jgi:hypothetical protein
VNDENVKVLVAAPDAYLREKLLRASGSGAVSTGLDYLPHAVRSLQPGALVIDAGGETDLTRRTLARGRDAAECLLPAVLMLSESSHGPLPVELLPSVRLPRTALRPAVGAALALLGGASLAAPADPEDVGIGWSRERQEVVGPLATVRLTASETAIFRAVFEANGAAIPPERLAWGLWGRCGPTG